MAEILSPDVVVYVCKNCFPKEAHLPRQWRQSGARVMVREVPCSGKLDAQYLLHAVEGGGRGCCVAACPKGACHLAQGNYRAEIRVRMLQRLLGEIGLEPERIELLHISPAESPSRAEQLVHESVRRICAVGENPLRAARAMAQPALAVSRPQVELADAVRLLVTGGERADRREQVAAR